jgi:hypothetical protein
MAKGKKTGGRKKGTPNHITVERKAKLSEAQMAGLTPLDYMLGILRDEDAKPDARMAAAVHAAPYIHPKLATIEHGGKDGSPVVLKVHWPGMPQGNMSDRTDPHSGADSPLHAENLQPAK